MDVKPIPSKKRRYSDLDFNLGSTVGQKYHVINKLSTLSGHTDLMSSIISSQVPAWKRNILRICMVLLAACLAVIFRDSFAYISAFTGKQTRTVMHFGNISIESRVVIQLAYHISIC